MKLETLFKAKGHKLFDPQLPDEKLQAIDAIGFGIVDKIYLEFSEPVFNPTFDWNYFLYNDEGISYSAEDAAKDWTRFLVESFVVDSSLASLWLSGTLLCISQIWLLFQSEFLLKFFEESKFLQPQQFRFVNRQNSSKT